MHRVLRFPTSHSRSDDKITTLELDDRVGPPVSAQLVYRERHQISTMALLSVVSFSFSYAPGSLTPTPMVGQRVAVSAPQLLPTVGVSRSQLAAVRCQEAAAAAAVEQETSPPPLESAVGFDFVPLLTALQAGEFREADFITRDALIKIAGPAAEKRGFVYWTEAPKLPMEDVMRSLVSNE